MDELRKNGRAETIRATGAVLIDSVLLYFLSCSSRIVTNPSTRARLIWQSFQQPAFWSLEQN
jgi:hypothetical protein